MTLDEYNGIREQWGESLYKQFCAREQLGFFRPPWDDLPEDSKESFRVGAVKEGVGSLADDMRHIEKCLAESDQAQRDELMRVHFG